MTSSQHPETTPETAPEVQVGGGPSPETFEAYATAGNRVCVLFTARWCVAGGILARQLADDPPGAPVTVVDVDAFPHLADRYHVHSLPAAVLFREGERGRLVGAFGVAQVKALVARGLATDTAEIDEQPGRRRRSR